MGNKKDLVRAFVIVAAVAAGSHIANHGSVLRLEYPVGGVGEVDIARVADPFLPVGVDRRHFVVEAEMTATAVSSTVAILRAPPAT